MTFLYPGEDIFIPSKRRDASRKILPERDEKVQQSYPGILVWLL